MLRLTHCASTVLLVQPATHLSLFDLLFTEHCGDFFVCLSDSLRSQNGELSNSVKALEISQKELEKRLAALQLQHQQDNTKLQTQLDEADNHSKTLEREV